MGGWLGGAWLSLAKSYVPKPPGKVLSHPVAPPPRLIRDSHIHANFGQNINYEHGIKNCSRKSLVLKNNVVEENGEMYFFLCPWRG